MRCREKKKKGWLKGIRDGTDRSQEEESRNPTEEENNTFSTGILLIPGIKLVGNRYQFKKDIGKC